MAQAEIKKIKGGVIVIAEFCDDATELSYPVVSNRCWDIVIFELGLLPGKAYLLPSMLPGGVRSCLFPTRT